MIKPLVTSGWSEAQESKLDLPLVSEVGNLAGLSPSPVGSNTVSR